MLTRKKKKHIHEENQKETAQEKRIIHEKCPGKLLRHLVLGHCKQIYISADTVFVTPGEVS